MILKKGSRWRNVVNDSADVTSAGRSFQICGPILCHSTQVNACLTIEFIARSETTSDYLFHLLCAFKLSERVYTT